MHSGGITIDNITKIEGTADLKVTIKNDRVTDLKFIIKDYRRFYTQAVRGKPIVAVPSFLSRIRLSFIHQALVGAKAASTRPRRILIMGFVPDQNRGPL